MVQPENESGPEADKVDEAPAPGEQPPIAYVPEGEGSAVLRLLEQFKRGNDQVAEAIPRIASVLEGFARQSPAEVMATAPDLSLYRTVTHARGVQEANLLLAQGWDLISCEMCEEVLVRRGVGAQHSKIIWRPYYTLGKREQLAETDRQAVAQDAERRTWEAGVPVGDEPEPEADAPSATEPEEPHPVGGPARGRVVVTQKANTGGFEGSGGLRDR